MSGIYCLQNPKSKLKNILSWVLPNPVDPVSIWPEPDPKESGRIDRNRISGRTLNVRIIA